MLKTCRDWQAAVRQVIANVLCGGVDGMLGGGGLMNGGLEVTSGGDRRARLLALLLFA